MDLPFLSQSPRELRKTEGKDQIEARGATQKHIIELSSLS